ncbi:MAG: ComEC/Rec2 family competence protein [Chloroflexota bacterium]
MYPLLTVIGTCRGRSECGTPRRYHPVQTAAVFSLPFVTGYLGISDMGIPSIRSFIMITLFLFGLLLQRKGFWLNTLLCAACIILLIDPSALLNLSFQLSFIAVLCIGLAEEAERKPAGQSGNDAEPDDPSSPTDLHTRCKTSACLLKQCLSLPRSALLVSPLPQPAPPLSLHITSTTCP